MRRFKPESLTIALIALLAAVGSLPMHAGISVTPEGRIYRGYYKAKSFTVQLPAPYEVRAENFMGTAVIFWRAPESPDARFTEMISVHIDRLWQETSVAKIMDDKISGSTGEFAMIRRYTEGDSECVIYSLTYLRPSDNERIDSYNFERVRIIDGYCVAVSCTTLKDRFVERLDEFESISQSFSFDP
ncbi:hypothetical protein [Pelagicoccus mobilis]|uniref:DUF1795 domain-containing protein n=1 Tax=Pelagicoccus mobilis TaxID=415221 RepID=A0A934VU70_9BACT|nr:hypothetical protein [Pelagicoccus mobilis]MBK1880249.1 hypothetical protein [Pelagicoccus mobilis]